MKVFNYSKIVFYLASICWLILTALNKIDFSQSMLYLGGLSVYLSIENLFKLYAHFYTDYENPKLSTMAKKYTEASSTRYYSFLLIGLYLVIGVFLIYVGMRGHL